MEDLYKTIINAIKEIAEMRGSNITEPLSDDTVLLESGLDSLGFAILVAKLEEELGYDPFVLMKEPVYPRTLAEFVGIYRKYSPQ